MIKKVGMLVLFGALVALVGPENLALLVRDVWQGFSVFFATVREG